MTKLFFHPGTIRGLSFACAVFYVSIVMFIYINNLPQMLFLISRVPSQVYSSFKYILEYCQFKRNRREIYFRCFRAYVLYSSPV
jgi:hypothetical protein